LKPKRTLSTVEAVCYNRNKQNEEIMQWPEIRKAYPDQWLIIEALQAHSTPDHRRILDKVSVVEQPTDGSAAMSSYRKLHQQYPEREFYFVHTSREEL